MNAAFTQEQQRVLHENLTVLTLNQQAEPKAKLNSRWRLFPGQYGDEIARTVMEIRGTVRCKRLRRSNSYYSLLSGLIFNTGLSRKQKEKAMRRLN